MASAFGLKLKSRRGLVEAALEGDVAQVTALLDGGADPNQVDDHGHTALIKAVMRGRPRGIPPVGGRGNLELLGLLCDRGADPVSQLASASHSSVAAFQRLLENGSCSALHNLQQPRCTTSAHPPTKGVPANATHSPASLSVYLSPFLLSSLLLLLLLLHGLAVLAPQNRAGETDNTTPIQQAAARGLAPAVRLLLDRGADPNQGDLDGETALMWSSDRGHLRVVRALLERGAAPNQPNRAGWTAAMCSTEGGHIGVLALLAVFGADLQCQVAPAAQRTVCVKTLAGRHNHPEIALFEELTRPFTPIQTAVRAVRARAYVRARACMRALVTRGAGHLWPPSACVACRHTAILVGGFRFPPPLPPHPTRRAHPTCQSRGRRSAGGGWSRTSPGSPAGERTRAA